MRGRKDNQLHDKRQRLVDEGKACWFNPKPAAVHVKLADALKLAGWHGSDYQGGKKPKDRSKSRIV